MTITQPTATLSLTDIARLGQVRRPVVTMWRKREKDGHPFPRPAGDGRFPAGDVIDWLEQTQRGNNPHVRRDAAVTIACANHDDTALERILVLLAVRASTQLSLSDADAEDLLDLVDELDPDDAWLFGEAEDADIQLLGADADAVADAAWTTADAYEALLSALRVRSRPASSLNVEPGDQLAALLMSVARALRGSNAALVDIGGTAADALLLAGSEDDIAEVDLVLAIPERGADSDARRVVRRPNDRQEDEATRVIRTVRRRYAAHRRHPAIVRFGDDWALPDGSVVLASLPRDPSAALDVLDEVALQLSGTTTALVVGTASALVDPLPRELEARRDQFLRGPRRTLTAIVRLPQGLTRGGTREHLALWLLRTGAPEAVRVGDLSGLPAGPAMWQRLLDDLLGTVNHQRDRAFALLQRVPGPTLLASGGSLVAHDRVTASEIVPSAGDDAARIRQLLDALATPVRTGFEHLAPLVHASRPLRHVALGEATRARHMTIIAGTRMGDLPTGGTPLWTAGAVTNNAPHSVDLLTLTSQHPGVHLTQPGDIVFTSAGQPRAIVDAPGGAAVAYPARVIRVARGAPFSARAIAASINELPTGNGKWRTWPIPVASDPAEADGVLARIDDLAAELHQRQTQANELRRLAVRSVLSGAVSFHAHTDQPGLTDQPDPTKGD